MARVQDVIAARAAQHVDNDYHRQQRDLKDAHRDQEQRSVNYHKAQSKSFEEKREDAEAQHAQRLRSIEVRRDHIAEQMHKQHNSFAGRLERLTPKGRARQAERFERLNERMAQMQERAIRQHNGRLDRHDEAHQRARLAGEKEIKQLRQENLDARQQHTKNHEQTRDRKIADRLQAHRQVLARDQKQELALTQKWQKAGDRTTLRDEWKTAQSKRTLRDDFQRSGGHSLSLPHR